MLRQFATWLKQAASGWIKDNAMRMSSSLAYYTLLSLAPILVLVVSIAGIFLGEEAARGRIAQDLSKRMGPEVGSAVESIILHARDPEDSLIGTLVGLLLVLLGASGVFGELQAAMNAIWHVEPKPGRGVRGFLHDRITAFAMVLSVALMLLVFLLVGAGLALLDSSLDGVLPGSSALWQLVDFLLSIAAVVVLFALSFKLVPDVSIRFRDVWSGAVLTALLFALGELGLAFYLKRTAIASPYGAAGSVIVLVVWVYYFGQILFYGAEFIKVRAVARSIEVQPKPHARWTDTPEEIGRNAATTRLIP